MVNRALFALVGVLVLVLVIAQAVMMKDREAHEPAVAEPASEDVRDRGGAVLQRVPVEPVYTDERGQEAFQSVADKVGNRGAALDALVQEGLLTDRVYGVLVPAREGRQLSPELNYKALSKVGVEALELGEDDGPSILKEFSEDDPVANGRALVKLALWVRPINTSITAPGPEERLAALRESDAMTGLPQTIVIRDVLFYGMPSRLLGLTDVPAEVLDRVVFRNCVFAGASFQPNRPMRLRFESCYFTGGTLMTSSSEAGMELSLTDCIVRAAIQMHSGQLIAANSLLLDYELNLTEGVWAKSSVQTSVVLNAMQQMRKPEAPRDQDLSVVLSGLTSNSVIRMSDEGLQQLERSRVLPDDFLRALKAARG